MPQRTGATEQAPSAPSLARQPLPRVWLVPILGALVLGLVLAVALALLRYRIDQTVRATTEDDTRAMAASLQLRLDGNQDYLHLLAAERADGALEFESFQARAAPFVESHPELINITWVDASLVIRDVSPREANRQIIGLRLELTEPKRAALWARQTRLPAYTRPFVAIQGMNSFEVWMPVFAGDEFRGLFAAVYSSERLLEQAVPPSFGARYHISLADETGSILSELGDGNGGEGGFALRVPLASLDNGLAVVVEPKGRQSIGWGMLLLLFLCGLSLLGMLYGTWALRRELRHRLETETALRTSQENLRTSEERFRLAVQSAHIGIWDLRPTTGVLTWDARCKELFGLPPDAQVDYDVFLAGLHPEDRERAHQINQAALRGEDGGYYSTEYRTVGLQDGRLRWILAQGRAYSDEKGQVERYVGTVRDITPQKLLEQGLNEAIRTRDEFLSIASHELKTPLTALKLQTQVIQRARLKGGGTSLPMDTLIRIIQGIDRQVDRLTRLVEDMLDVSRLKTGKLAIQREEVRLVELIHEVVERLRPQLEAVGCPLTVELDETLVGFWDRYRLEQVFTNLLSNCMKYGAGKPVTLAVQKDGEHVRIHVRDQGIGIAKEKQQLIFERFERAVPDSGISGLGLGLYITRGILEQHGGTIGVHSEPGQGATFEVELPLGPSPGR